MKYKNKVLNQVIKKKKNLILKTKNKFYNHLKIYLINTIIAKYVIGYHNHPRFHMILNNNDKYIFFLHIIQLFISLLGSSEFFLLLFYSSYLNYFNLLLNI